MQNKDEQLKNDLKAYREGWHARERLLQYFIPQIDKYLSPYQSILPARRKQIRKDVLDTTKNYIINLEENKIEQTKNQILEKEINKFIEVQIIEETSLFNLYENSFGIPPESELSLKEIQEKADIFAKELLTEKEYFIFKNRFPYRNVLLREIGEIYGRSRERVRGIEERALRKIKEAFKKELKPKEEKRDSLLEKELIEYLKPHIMNFLKSKDIGGNEFFSSNRTYIRDLELSVRAYNTLRNAGIETLEQLAQKTEMEMLNYPNFGKKSLFELWELLKKYKLDFGMSAEEILLRKYPRWSSEIKDYCIKKGELLDKMLNRLGTTESLKCCLEKNELYTLADLAKLTEEEFKSRCAEHLEEAKELLTSFGFGFGMKIERFYFIEN